MLSPMRLSAEEARIIGSLVEKDLTTPDHYPLTIKSLLAACNQTSNRDPVVTYDEHTVLSALTTLKEQKLVRFVLPSHGRSAVRYRHVLPEILALDQRQCALVAVLLLRGPQTIGELRSRTDRMVDFDSLEEVEDELRFLSRVEDPLATSLGRRPGQKEERWICPLVAHSPSPVAGISMDDDHHDDEAVGLRPVPGDPLDDLRSELVDLRSEIAELRRDVEELRASLGG
jgi:uncharacterized protein YceH (UPF0502 family)